ncbi:hypothetical protein NMG60_11018813 [Bertholletia excelsa]
MEDQVEVKSQVDEILHTFGGKKAHHVPNMCSDKVHNIKLHEGDWGSQESVKEWTYVTEGKVETFKEKFYIDEEKKEVHLTTLEGSTCLGIYKSYKIIFQLFARESTNVVKITIEYEKRNENAPPPQKYMSFIKSLIQDIDAGLVNA